MCEVPLLADEKIFAAEHHGLVYKFLNTNHLPEDEYYDVVIFGYLKAVRNYLSNPDLQIYSFATIGWNSMRRSLSSYYRAKNCKKRKAEVISIHEGLYPDSLSLEEVLPGQDSLMQQLETKLLLHDLAARVSRQQMDMVRLKYGGYGLRDIARSQSTTVSRVKELLEDVRSILLEICHE